MNKTNFLLWIAFVAFASYLAGQIFVPAGSRALSTPARILNVAHGRHYRPAVEINQLEQPNKTKNNL